MSQKFCHSSIRQIRRFLGRSIGSKYVGGTYEESFGKNTSVQKYRIFRLGVKSMIIISLTQFVPLHSQTSLLNCLLDLFIRLKMTHSTIKYPV